MTFISFEFFLFLAVTVVAYYLMPVKYRWVALFASSVLFYIIGGVVATLVTVAVSVFSYIMAQVIEKNEKGKKQFLIVSISVVVLLGILSLLKVCGNFTSFADKVIIPTGISFYTLSIIGYLLDVYWRKEKAERNIWTYLTFVFFFPKILQGPISRHKYLYPQLTSVHRFDYRKLCFSMQLILWGLFKKIVLADRMAILVSTVYGNICVYAENGIVLIVAMLFSAMQLYCDFSGYTDMALGIAGLFGIELEQNFNHPFFARSASEFWQRWHMTLSGWFKDYLFLPVSRSPFVKKISKKMGSRYGAAARKKTMMVCSIAVVWLATGMWHGTGINYIVWGAYWGIIIIASELCSDFFGRIKSALNIRESSWLWIGFQIIRTCLIFVVGKMISAQHTLADVGTIIKGIITNTRLSDYHMLMQLGLDKIDVCIVTLGVILIFIVSCIQEKGIVIRNRISEWNPIIRWGFLCVSVSAILLFGIYGAEYNTSTFAYQFF